MLKKIFSIFIMILLLVGLCGEVFANDTYTTTSVVNGITANWEYKLNESNQIVNLKCTNPMELTGRVEIPSILDEKIVITLGKEAFKSATEITEVILPETVTGWNCKTLLR